MDPGLPGAAVDVRGNHVLSAVDVAGDRIKVTFDENVSQCAYAVTAREHPLTIYAAPDNTDSRSVLVSSRTSAGQADRSAFSLIVEC